MEVSMDPYWDAAPGGTPSPQTIRLGAREFWVVPKPAGSGENQARQQRSQLQSYNSSKLPEFKYQKLPKLKKRIRLLQLQSGTIYGPEIHCTLIEADYDNEFHIPTTVTEAQKAEEDAKQREWDSLSEEDRNIQEEAILETKQEEEQERRHLREKEKEKVDAMTEDGKKKYEDEKEEEEVLQNEKRFDAVSKNAIPYEALSWCWGTTPAEYAVTIRYKGVKYKKKVRRELGLALKYLRLQDQPRILWIDAICINQDDDDERSQQVQMMSRIYTRAKQVCIWLGEDSDESKTAIDFINQEIMELKNFDTICSDRRYTDKWRALMMLMQREWFSRRWVVQEIALASKARLYCGPDSISWKELAVAVELFVEVETATHRLSEIMKKDEKFRHVPGWFEHVSELGASLLVQATGRVFRAQRTPLHETTPDDSAQVQELRKQAILREGTIDPLDRRSLLSLEYLVSTLFIFKATEPRDAVYSLLAIARDATPFAKSSFRDGDHSLLILSVMENFLEEKPFVVDYARPYSDVCRDYVEFTILRKYKLDPVQALDVLCRPWALDPPTGKSIRVSEQSETKHKDKRPRLMPKRDKNKAWMKKSFKIVRENPEGLLEEEGEESIQEALHEMNGRTDQDSEANASSSLEGGIDVILGEEQGLDPGEAGGGGSSGAGEPSQSHEQATGMEPKTGKDPVPPLPDKPDRYTWLRKYDLDCGQEMKKDERDLADYWKDAEHLKPIKDFEQAHSSDADWRPHPEGWKDVLWYFPFSKYKGGGSSSDSNGTSKSSSAAIKDILPSWVALASHAPFTLYPHAGMHIHKAGRSNADPLVGQPQDGHRNYSAAQTNPVDLDTLKFRKRQKCNHYSLYVRGFELDTVETVLDASQSGNIPKSWLDLGEWESGEDNSYKVDPPDNFWRTLVADRGRDNRNPPYYYATACKESVQKGGIASGSVNTSDLINNERNSIVAEFCRRVQAVIWSRHLFKTKRGKLGLARSVEKGDKVCILYGCTVPVIVRQTAKGRASDFPTSTPSSSLQPRPKTRDETIKEEEFDDAIEALKSCVRKLEAKLERKARYERRKREFGPAYEQEIKDAIKSAREVAIKQLKRDFGTFLEDYDGPEPPDTGVFYPSTAAQPSPLPSPSDPRSAPLTGGAGPGPGPGTMNRTDTNNTLSAGHRLQGAQSTWSMRTSGRNLSRAGTNLTTILAAGDTDKNMIIAAAKLSGASKLPAKRYTEEPVDDKGVYYEFKGEAYVHGMMDGEALRMKFYEKIGDVLFELR